MIRRDTLVQVETVPQWLKLEYVFQNYSPLKRTLIKPFEMELSIRYMLSKIKIDSYYRPLMWMIMNPDYNHHKRAAKTLVSRALSAIYKDILSWKGNWFDFYQV